MVWNFPDDYFVIMLVIILFIIIFVIFYIIKKIKQKKQRPKKTGPKITGDSKENLLLFDKKIKNYFKRYLKLDSEIGYTKIAEKLREKNKYALANFCDRMNYALYSGKEIDEGDIKALNKHFHNITHIKKSKKKKTERKSKK